MLKHLDASLMSFVTAMWQKLELNTSKMKSEIELTLYEKQREIDAVRRKVEWEMNGLFSYLMQRKQACAVSELR